MNLNEQQLINAGYKRYESGGDHEGSICFYQKRIRNQDGLTLYFVDIYQYPVGWQPEAQFHLSGRHSFNVVAMGFETLEEVERFFQSAYERLECVPYDRT